MKHKPNDDGLKPGQTMFKAADGKRYMLLVTSNSYTDREAETLTSAALTADVDRHWTNGDGNFASDNPLLFWHDDRMVIGDIVWGDMRGPFYVELARESDSPLASKLWDAIETSDDDWGASHQFAYYSQHRNADGDYSRIFKKETSILPRDMAANLLTYSGVLSMSKARDDYLDKLLGVEGVADALDKGMAAIVALLKKQGVEHKSMRRGKVRRDENDHTERTPDDPPGGIIVNDSLRLDSKRQRVGVSERIHNVLRAMMSSDQLEQVYNAAEANKALTTAEDMALRDERLIAEDIPQALAAGLGKVFGSDGGDRMIDDLLTRLMFTGGKPEQKAVKAMPGFEHHATFGLIREETGVKSRAPSPTAADPTYVNDPVFGRVKPV